MRRTLHTGASIWGNGPSDLPMSALRRDRCTDVLVVGAGISGALVAESLIDRGHRILVVDRRGPAEGSTMASTALLQHELDMPLVELARRIGRPAAEQIWRRSRLAVDALRDRVQLLGIDAGVAMRETLYLQGTRLDRDALAEECAARRRAGFEVEFLPCREVIRRYGIDRRSAIRSFGNLIADPRRLALGFLRHAIARGAELLVPVTVTSLEPVRGGVVARTEQGPTLRCRDVVLATGYELFPGVPHRGHRAVSTWAIATRPQRGHPWPTECLIWEASDPYLYLRVGPNGEVICGGEDEEIVDATRRDALLGAKTAALERKLARLLPRIDARAERAWTGTFGTSTTGTPTIGVVPGMPRCHAVLGYGGNGITFSMMAAQMLGSIIDGHEDADASLVSFERGAAASSRRARR